MQTKYNLNSIEMFIQMGQNRLHSTHILNINGIPEKTNK